jgi:hypothetical protein
MRSKETKIMKNRIVGLQFRYSLYFILLLSTSCNVKQPEKVSDKPKPPGYAERVADNEKKSLENIERLDEGVEIIAMTEELANQMGVMDYYQIDPGFAKWLVLFHELPGSPPYEFQQKRLIQPKHDRYYLCPGPSSEDILKAKNSNEAIGLVVNTRGYLPGEKITLCLNAQEACREAVFYPRPLLLKRESGELLVKGSLLCARPGHTLYAFDICGIGEQEKYKLVSHSGKEILSQDLQGPIMFSLAPEVVGLPKGIAKLEFQFEDGAIYTMELPWGHELLEYKAGNK